MKSQQEVSDFQKVAVKVVGASEDELKDDPFYGLYLHAFNAVVAHHPTAIDELLKTMKGVTPVLVASTLWDLRYLPKTKSIRLSTGAIRMIWASALSYFLLYKTVLEGTHGGQVVVLDPSTPLGRAFAYYHWTVEQAAGRQSPEPNNAPVPRLRLESDNHDVTPEEFASDLTLGAVGFWLLHEVGHHALRHQRKPPGPEAIKMEQVADAFALNWIRRGTVGNPVAQEKARLILAITFGVAVAFHTIKWRLGRVKGPQTHPHPQDRMFDLLAKGDPDRHSISWGMAVAILSVHSNHVGIGLPDEGGHDTTYDAAAALVGHLTEGLRKSPPPLTPRP